MRASKANEPRWWPAPVILALSAALHAWIWLGPEPTRQFRMIRTFIAAFVTVALLLVWFFFLSRFSRRAKAIGLAILLLVGPALALSVEIRGVTGDLRPLLAWRWAPDDARLGVPRPEGETEPGPAVEEEPPVPPSAVEEVAVVAPEAEREPTPEAAEGESTVEPQPQSHAGPREGPEVQPDAGPQVGPQAERAEEPAVEPAGRLEPTLERPPGPAPEPEAEPSGVEASTAAVEEPSEADGAAGEWPQFLGPERNAVVRGVLLADDWGEQPPRELWRRSIGAGWASFAVADGLAVTLEQRGDLELVSAYELETGEPRWGRGAAVRFDRTIGGVGPRSTPAIAGGRVYAMGATGLLRALDLTTGELLWSRDVVEENGGWMPGWGKSSSPLVVDGLVVVAGGDRGGALAAYRAEDGEPVWAAGDDRSAYASPILVTLGGVRQIVIVNDGTVTGHDPASGSVLWSHAWNRGQPNVAAPLVLPGDRLLVSKGYGVGAELFAVKRGAEGLVSEHLWRSPRLKLKFTHAVLFDGYVYGLDDGVLACLDPATGERCWRAGRYGHGQVLLVEDRLLIQAENGDVVLVAPAPDGLRELARFTALDGKTWNIPTVVGNRLLVRNHHEAAAFELPLRSGEGR